MTLSLREKAEAKLREGVNAQNQLYDEIVLEKLGEDDTVVERAYREYQEKLGGFDANGFRKCVNILVTEVKPNNPELFSLYVDKFNSIPDYITHRNCFDEKRKELLNSDGSNADKQDMFDCLDRNRTNAHNRVIDLFNSLNEFADKHKITRPYPNKGIPFNKNIPDDRAHVASILERQEPLLDTVNLFMEDERVVESPMKATRYMGLSETLAYMKNLENTIKINEDKKALGR